MIVITKRQIFDSLQLGLMQFLTYGICSVSWRAVAQANIMAAVIADGIFGSLQFFVIKKMIKAKDEDGLLNWFGYMSGGVLGTIVGIYLSIFWLGK